MYRSIAPCTCPTLLYRCILYACIFDVECKMYCTEYKKGSKYGLYLHGNNYITYYNKIIVKLLENYVLCSRYLCTRNKTVDFLCEISWWSNKVYVYPVVIPSVRSYSRSQRPRGVHAGACVLDLCVGMGGGGVKHSENVVKKIKVHMPIVMMRGK